MRAIRLTNEEIPPTRVAATSAARLACSNHATRWKFGVASVLGDESEGNGAVQNDTDRLPHGEEGKKPASVLRKKLDDLLH